jgi:hypothetical protein
MKLDSETGARHLPCRKVKGNGKSRCKTTNLTGPAARASAPRISSYRFRPVTWREQMLATPLAGEDNQSFHLALALDNVSGYTIKTLDEARMILRAIPAMVRQRIFTLYGASLPDTRYLPQVSSTRPLNRAYSPLR